MKKTLFFLIAIVFLFGFSALAAETTDATTAQSLNVAAPTVLPTNPLYFLKEIGRNIQTAFTFNPIKKAEIRLKFANEKLAEAEKVSEAGNTTATNNALERYSKEMDKVKQYVDVLKKDNPDNQKLLEKMTENNLNHQQILNKIAEKKTEVQQKITEVKDKAVESLTSGSFKLANPETVKQTIEKVMEQNKVETSDKVELLKKIEEKAPELAKKTMIAVQNTIISDKLSNVNLNQVEKQKLEGYMNQLKEKTEYKQVVLEDFANKIISDNKEVFNSLNNISEEDKTKLKDYAQDLLSNQNIDYTKVVNDINSLNISTEAKKVINTVKDKVIEKTESKEKNVNSATPAVPGVKSGTGVTEPAVPANKAGLANPASTFCTKNGYKLEIRSNSDGSQYGVCVFTDGKECDEWKFYRKECGTEYIK